MATIEEYSVRSVVVMSKAKKTKIERGKIVGNLLSGFGCLLIFVGLILAFGVFPAIKNEDVRKFINIWDAETHNRAEFVSRLLLFLRIRYF